MGVMMRNGKMASEGQATALLQAWDELHSAISRILTASPGQMIKAIMDWQHSHSVVDDLRTHVRHWREGYGKLEGNRREMLDVLKRAIAVWDAEVFDEAAANAVLKAAVETVARMEPRA